MAFADADDIKTRLEETSLSTTALATATALCDVATAVICDAAGQADEDWFDDLPVVKRNLIKGLTVSMVCRAMASPQGLTRASESLGAHSRDETYGDTAVALLLSPPEQALVVNVSGKTSSGSVRVPALPHDVYVTEP